MKEVEPAGHVMFNSNAWVISDPVVFWSIVTVVVSALVVGVAISKAMSLAEKERKEKEGGTNT